MADHRLIRAELDILCRRLPPADFDEVADGLREAYEARLSASGDPDRAAMATVAEFGDADTITAAFIGHSPWRRGAMTLLATGPIIGGLWGITLVASGWAQPVPLTARAMFGGALLVIVLALIAVSLTHRHYRYTRQAALASASALTVLDALMVAGALALGATWGWPLTLAIAASAVRALGTVRMLDRWSTPGG